MSRHAPRPAGFGLQKRINGKILLFQYDADHNRVLQTETVSGVNSTTYYLPDGEQTPSAGAGPVWHTYFEADGERVAEDAGPTGALVHHYFHNDNQASIGLITGDTFNPNSPNPVQDELSDVFGQPRLPSGAIDPNWGTTDVSKRRYINQEDLTDAQLIDLNARVYDPLLAKFMSPDPVIADQDDSQSWNAYAYSHNNPMSKEDPTGLDDHLKVPCGDKCKPEQGNPAAAISGGGAHFVAHHVPAGIRGLAQRAAAQGPHSAAARSLVENYGGVAGSITASNGDSITFAGVASDIAVDGSDVQATDASPAQCMGMCHGFTPDPNVIELTPENSPALFFVGGLIPSLVPGAEEAALYEDFTLARNAALGWLEKRGFKAEAETLGKFGPNAGKPIGMQTSNGKIGFRVEYDPKHGGPHINTWAHREKGVFSFPGYSEDPSVPMIMRQSRW